MASTVQAENQNTSKISKIESSGDNKLIRRPFKGIEGFLKRIAYNLGNTPSQTEVKVISCIPIDVTDLQEKITVLEKELKGRSSRRERISSALYRNIKERKSDIGVLCNLVNTDQSNNHTDVTFGTESKLSTPIMTDPSNIVQCNNVKLFAPGDIQHYKCTGSFLKKKKKLCRNKKLLNQYIYHAQTTDSPFNTYKDTEFTGKKLPGINLDHLMETHYNGSDLTNVASEISKFSSPVCRDTQKESSVMVPASDICSCCHGTFHNIDNQIVKLNKMPITILTHQIRHNAEYYDSNLYDTVPVREKSVKTKKIFNVPKKKDVRRPLNTSSCSEYAHTKIRSLPIYTHVKVSQQPATYTETAKKPFKNYKREHLVKDVNRQVEFDGIKVQDNSKALINCGAGIMTYPNVNKNPINSSKSLETDLETNVPNEESSKYYLNNGEYQSLLHNNLPVSTTDVTEVETDATLDQIKSILQSFLKEIKMACLIKEDKDKEQLVRQIPYSDSLQPNLNSMEENQSDKKTCQQANWTSELISNVTDVAYSCTIHQHRNIGDLYDITSDKLPNCSKESYKVNETFPRPTSNMIPNNLSSLHNQLPSNSLLDNSHTDNKQCCSFNMHHFHPSCSKDYFYNQFYYPPHQYDQNIPVYYQPPPKPTFYFPTKPQLKTTVTMATNTENQIEQNNRRKETDHLIKEIYKSLALNVEEDRNINPRIDKQVTFLTNQKTIVETCAPIVVETSESQVLSELYRSKDEQYSEKSSKTTIADKRSRLLATTDTEVRRSKVYKELTTEGSLKVNKELTEDSLTTGEEESSMERLEIEEEQSPEESSKAGEEESTEESFKLEEEQTSSSDIRDLSTSILTSSTSASEVSKLKKSKLKMFSKMLNPLYLFKRIERKRNKKKMLELEMPTATSESELTTYRQKGNKYPHNISPSYARKYTRVRASGAESSHKSTSDMNVSDYPMIPFNREPFRKPPYELLYNARNKRRTQYTRHGYFKKLPKRDVRFITETESLS